MFVGEIKTRFFAQLLNQQETMSQMRHLRLQLKTRLILLEHQMDRSFAGQVHGVQCLQTMASLQIFSAQLEKSKRLLDAERKTCTIVNVFYPLS